MSPAGIPTLSVLIPAHNGARWISETLSRLPAAAASHSWEAVVADNASTDDTLARCRGIPGVRTLPCERNGGFSNAVNRAAAQTAGRILVLINQDLLLRPNSLAAVVEFLSCREAIVGGNLFSESGGPQASCGPFPSAASTLGRLVLPPTLRKSYLKPLPKNRPSIVDWVTGAFMAFPRRFFDSVGGFDEGFFMYYEDVDFCLRAKQKGFPVCYLPAAEAVHLAPYAERRDQPDWLRREVRISQMRYFAKHRPSWEAAAIRVLNRAYFCAKGWDWPPVSRFETA